MLELEESKDVEQNFQRMGKFRSQNGDIALVLASIDQPRLLVKTNVGANMWLHVQGICCHNYLFSSIFFR